MDILFEIVSRHKFSADFPTSRIFGETGGLIGRSPECEWQLSDKSKQISRQHALVTFYNGSFYIEDLSSNGIFLSLGKERLAKGNPHKIEHGDGFIFGEYTIMARLMQNPSSYAESSIDMEKDLLATEDPVLSLDPIRAMEEEVEKNAKKRLGEFNDILGMETAKSVTGDGNTLGQEMLLPVIPVPEGYVLKKTPLAKALAGDGAAGAAVLPAEGAAGFVLRMPDPWDAKGSLMHDRPEYELPPQPEPPKPEPPVREVYKVPETELFFKALGFSKPPEEQDERERIMKLAAELLVASVEGISISLQNRAECKSELRLSMTTTSLAVNNNALKFSPTAGAALSTMLGPLQKGLLDPVYSVKAAFHDLHSHHMGLLSGARAAVNSVLEKLSPDAMEMRLDSNGPVRMGRTAKLWSTYLRTHNSLCEDQESFSGFFMQDFARAYEAQVRTLNPASHPHLKGDKK